MADNPQKVEVEAELDASQTVRGARAAAEELTRVIAVAGELERLTRSIFTGGNLPKQLESYVKALQTVQQLPAQMAQVQRTSRNISSGGPAAAMQNATLRGAIANIQTDPALQLQRIEKETNKVLEARAEIYRRVRAALPDGASALRVSQAYRQALNTLGDMPAKGSEAYTAWLDKTRNEVRQFERDWTATTLAEAQKRAQAQTRATQQTLADQVSLVRKQQAETKRLFQQDLGAIMAGKTPEERRSLASQSIERIGDYASRRGLVGFDPTQLFARYDEAENAHYVRSLQRNQDYADKLLRQEAERENRRFDQDQALAARLERAEAEAMNRKFDREQKRSPEARQQRFADAYEERQAFNNYRGGAAAFEGRASFLRDYAAMSAVLGAFTFAAQGTVQLQASLKGLQAITQATDGEMASLTSTIFAVGNSTNYSVKEIAEAATVLGQAGYSARQVSEALPAIANLATAAGAGLNDAVQTVTSILDVYDLSIERSSEVSNMLAQALNGSKLSFDQLSLGIQYAANVSKDGGVQFDEMTAALGAMAQAGIKSGSTMGTGLRALIEELDNPSQKFLAQLRAMGLTAADVDVKTVGLEGALRNLSESGFDSSKAMASFEIRAASAFSALSNNLDILHDLQMDMQGSQAATEAAATQMDSFAAQAQRFGNALIELASTAGAPFLAALQGIVSGGAGVVQILTTMGPAIQLVTTAIVALVAVNTVAWLARLVAGLAGANTVLAGFDMAAIRAALASGQFGAALGLSTAGIRAMTVALAASPVTWWVAGITLAITALTGFQAVQARANAKIDEARSKANEAAGEAQKYGDRVSELTDYINLLVQRHAALSQNTTMAAQAAETAAAKFSAWGLALSGAASQVDYLIQKLVTLRSEQAGYQLDQVNLERSANEKERAEILKGPDYKAAQTLAAQLQALAPRQVGNKDRQLFDASGISALLQRLQAGQLDATGVQQLAALLRKNQDNFSPVARGRSDQLLEQLTNGTFSRLNELNRTMARGNDLLAKATVDASPEASAITKKATQMRTAYADETQRINKVTDPVERNKQLAALQQRQISEWPQMAADIQRLAEQLREDPQVANLSAKQVIEELYRTVPGLTQLAQGARQPVTDTSIKNLQAQQAYLEARLRVAEQARDQAGASDLRAQRDQVARQVLTLQNPELDPLSLEQLIQDRLGANAEKGVASTESVERKDARIESANLAREVKALERKIEIMEGAASTGSTSFAAPIEGARITSEIGMRVDPITGQRRYHSGLDYAAPVGTSVRAAGAGEVTAASYDNLNGNFVRVKHADGFESIYDHLDKIAVKLGDIVQMGQEIGKSGNTGRSTGPHLHFTMKRNGEVIDPRDVMGKATDDQSTKQLQEMLDTWKAAKEKQIRAEGKASGADESDIQQRLADFQTEAKQYFDDVLGGNLQAAKKAVADAKLRTADLGAAQRSVDLKAFGGDLDEAMDQTLADYQTALEAELEAIDQEARAKGRDPAVFRDAIEKRQQAQREFTKKAIDAVLDQIEQFYAGELERIERDTAKAELALDREQADLDRLGNYYGARRLGDTHRSLGDIAGQKIKERRARLEVQDAQQKFDQAKDRRDSLATAYASAPDEVKADTLEKLQAANADYEALSDALEKAKINLTAIAGIAPSFASYGEAATAAWTAWADEIENGKSKFEIVADGLKGTLDTLKDGLKGFVKDTLSGTKSIGDAFKDLALSILDSMLNMFAELAAQQMFKWVLSLLPGGGSFGGGGGSMGPPLMALGGEVRPMAGGGEVTGGIPGRDSVHIKAMPGEILMRKSAVDMVGRENLLALNAAGNSRMSRAPAIEQPSKREGDTVNVWVVAPDQQPPPGPKDIVAAISKDITTGGQTKALIKAVVVGAV